MSGIQIILKAATICPSLLLSSEPPDSLSSVPFKLKGDISGFHNPSLNEGETHTHQTHLGSGAVFTGYQKLYKNTSPTIILLKI